MVFQGGTGEFFELIEFSPENKDELFRGKEDRLSVLWFLDDDSSMLVDEKLLHFKKNDLLFLTHFHRLKDPKISAAKRLQFNRPFFCILDHDSEVGCKGVLYYGASEVPRIHVEGKDLEVLSTTWRMVENEFDLQDDLQLEMLQMMLKRILILCTRVYKRSGNLIQNNTEQNELVREFNFLVESHFRTEHSVSAYAEMMFKSPKTISNVFKQMGEKSPLHFIQDRILLESRRLLGYTDKDVSEIAFDLGFNDVQSFSRFFKKLEGSAPSQWRNALKS